MFSFKQLLKRNNTNRNPLSKRVVRNYRIPLIGEKAPSFTAESTEGTINFPDDFNTNWKLILSHPMDFTPVCSSELIELANLQEEFEKLGISMIIVSTDQLETHIQWKKTLERLEYKKYPTKKISFPIVDDSSLVIANRYGMLHPESDNSRDVRGVFIIDSENVIRAEFFYPQEVGRNMHELLRTVIALQTVNIHNVMTPANWTQGDDFLVPFPLKSDMSAMNKDSGDYYQIAWFMIFKKDLNGNSGRSGFTY
jgi:peroxiredoxin 2/4